MKLQENKGHVTKLVKLGKRWLSEPFCFGSWLGRGQVGFEGRPSMSICPAVRSCPDLRRGASSRRRTGEVFVSTYSFVFCVFAFAAH